MTISVGPSLCRRTLSAVVNSLVQGRWRQPFGILSNFIANP